MFATNQISDSFHSKESISNGSKDVQDFLSAFMDEKALSTFTNNPKLNAGIHLAITKESSEYISIISARLFTLYRDLKRRPFVLQFLPSFITVYYDVLYQQSESATDSLKDACSTLDTFLVGLYNLSVLDDGHREKRPEFRIPNLTLPSIYHTPNPDIYAPTPLTQHAISKHEKKCEVVRFETFAPFDSVNSTTREQILWFLLIQYGINVSSMDSCSRQAYCKMAKKLLGQGFSFESNRSAKANDSLLPANGRRIHLSSRLMIEILGTLFYFKANSKDKEACGCMLLLKHRAEYELYADVLLMTESMNYLHEFENPRQDQDSLGIEIELPPTIDLVKQKRTATTTRSIKNRHSSFKNRPNIEAVIIENDILNATSEHSIPIPVETNVATIGLMSSTDQQDEARHGITKEKSQTKTGPIDSNSKTIIVASEQDRDLKSTFDNSDETTPMIDKTQTNLSTYIQANQPNSSPSSIRHIKPLSLTSTQAYFRTIQQQRVPSPNLQNVQTVINNDSDSNLTRSRPSSMKHKDKKETVATVRFMGTDEYEKNLEETFV